MSSDALKLNYCVDLFFQMTLGLDIFSGYIVVGVVYIVGSVIERQDGEAMRHYIVKTCFWFGLATKGHKHIFKCYHYTYRLTNEQRAAVADYFRVYKV